MHGLWTGQTRTVTLTGGDLDSDLASLFSLPTTTALRTRMTDEDARTSTVTTPSPRYVLTCVYRLLNTNQFPHFNQRSIVVD